MAPKTRHDFEVKSEPTDSNDARLAVWQRLGRAEGVVSVTLDILDRVLGNIPNGTDAWTDLYNLRVFILAQEKEK